MRPQASTLGVADLRARNADIWRSAPLGTDLDLNFTFARLITQTQQQTIKHMLHACFRHLSKDIKRTCWQYICLRIACVGGRSCSRVQYSNSGQSCPTPSGFVGHPSRQGWTRILMAGFPSWWKTRHFTTSVCWADSCCHPLIH